MARSKFPNVGICPGKCPIRPPWGYFRHKFNYTAGRLRNYLEQYWIKPNMLKEKRK